jgi:hypothetical protein
MSPILARSAAIAIAVLACSSIVVTGGLARPISTNGGTTVTRTPSTSGTSAVVVDTSPLTMVGNSTWTFDVPVKVLHVPTSENMIGVTCQVTQPGKVIGPPGPEATLPPGGPPRYNNILGNGFGWAKLSPSGEFKGTITVGVVAEALPQGSASLQYLCTLVFPREPSMPSKWIAAGVSRTGIPDAGARPGTSPVVNAHGTVP